ncbi:MAG: DUF1828 domain-containing protein [Gammaproteobacteria bacterium]|nr:DUF1828 domain-containing protein [Gammaproteobacteria bacterium]
MTLNTDAIRTLLCERLCAEVGIEQRRDGAAMLRTHFRFPDGDGYPIHLSETASGGLRLSDRGHTLMHISYEHDVDSFMDGTRGALLERIVQEEGLNWEGGRGALYLDTSPERLSQAVFSFGQALTRVYDLTLLSRSNVGSTFYDDLADLLLSVVDEEKIERDYQPEVANAQHYPVDYRIDGKAEIPLFVYGIPNRDKARLTTIMLSHFHLSSLSFESILVFEDQSEIPRVDLARLSDVGGDMISSLASRDDLNRKLLQRVAA